MKLFSSQLELRAIATICSKKKHSDLLLARLNQEHFHYPPAHAAYERVMKLVRTKGEVPSYSELTVDPVIDEDFRNILAASEYKRPIRNEQKLVRAFDNLDKYRKIREVYFLSKRALDKLKDPKVDIEEIMSAMSDKLAVARATVEHEEQMCHIGVGNNSTSVVKEILDGDATPTIPTGFKTFDEKNGGFFKGGVAVLSANSGGGKSVGALQLAKNMYEAGFSTCVLSLEMPKEQYMARFLSSISGIFANKIFLKRCSKDEKRKVKRAYKEFVLRGKEKKTRWTILAPNSDMSLDQLLLTCKPYKYDVITIDYISLLKDAAANDQAKALGEIARKCKVFATNTNTLIIILAQLNEEDKVKYARAIVENADHLWTWRYGESERESHQITIKVDKGRNQHCFPFEVTEDFSTMTMVDNGPAKSFDEDESSGKSVESIDEDGEDNLFMEED